MSSTPGKRTKVLNPEIRWEFTIPDAVPEENTGVYAWEKLRRVCRGLNKTGLKVTPVIPPECTAVFRRIDPASHPDFCNRLQKTVI